MKLNELHDRSVKHRRIMVGEVDCFFREAGPAHAPVVLLPHGYPCSSYQFRNLMPQLADRWRLLAPDFPGSGYTRAPAGFRYDFDGFAQFLASFLAALNVERFAIYLHDFGSQIGLRLCIQQPQRVAALIVQNGDIYMDALGPMYGPFLQYFAHPTPEGRAKLESAVSEEGFKHEFLNSVGPELAQRIPPDLWHLHWSVMTEERRQIVFSVLEGLKHNFDWFPRYQAYLREHRPATLIAWGPNDGYMPEESARAYLRDLPDAELHLLDGGHWLLETHLPEVAALCRDFLARTHV